jgi:sugar lactone lactonase YvrE
MMGVAASRRFFFLLAFASCAAAAQTYDGPESVEYHARLDRHLVGNTGGPILTRAADGTLGLFTDATSSPYGIELLGGTLYALDSGHLKGFDIDSAAPLLDHAIAGAAFLNGITSDASHTVYISDFSARNIHRIDVSDLEEPVAGNPVSTGSATPNGLVFDHAGQRVLIATWGSNAKILSLDVTGDAAPATLIQTTLSNIDGIALDCRGAIVVAAWGGCGVAGGCLARFEPPFALDTPFTVLAEGLSNPADIDFGRARGEIGVPESGSDEISLHASGCEAALFTGDFER